MWSDPNHQVNDLSSDTAYGITHCALIQRSVYEFVGGMTRVERHWFMEIDAMARILKATGFNILVADGREFLQANLRTDRNMVRDGWTWILFPSLAFDRILLVSLTTLIASVLILPFATALILLLLYALGGWDSSLQSSAVVNLFELLLIFAWWLIVIRYCQG